MVTPDAELARYSVPLIRGNRKQNGPKCRWKEL